MLVSQHGIFPHKATIKRLLSTLSFPAICPLSFLQLRQIFAQADHRMYLNFNRQRQSLCSHCPFTYFCPVMRANLLTGIQSAPCVLWGSFSTSCLTQQFKTYFQTLSAKARRSICVTHTWQVRNMHTHISHQNNLNLSAKQAQINPNQCPGSKQFKMLQRVIRIPCGLILYCLRILFGISYPASSMTTWTALHSGSKWTWLSDWIHTKIEVRDIHK